MLEGIVAWTGKRKSLDSEEFPSEAKSLLTFFLNMGCRRSFHDLHQAGAWAHREIQFALKVGNHVERRAVAQSIRSQVGIRQEATHPAVESPQIASRVSVLMVLRDMHRMEPDGVLAQIGSQLYTILRRVERGGFKVSGDSQNLECDSSARMPMQFTITLCGRLLINLSIGPRLRSDVHCRNWGGGSMPRCFTISR
jgi:hypothetical protein